MERKMGFVGVEEWSYRLAKLSVMYIQSIHNLDATKYQRHLQLEQTSCKILKQLLLQAFSFTTLL